MIKIGIIGTGYVGLVSGVCFASLGNKVICCDTNKEKINKLQNGIIPIYEPGLEDLLKNNKNNICFTTDLKYTIENSECIFIAVGTPMDEDGSADLSYVLSVANDIGKYINHHLFIIDKSTVPVGTADKVRDEINKNNKKYSFDVISNPEFLKEGTAIDDFLNPDRIVIGVDNNKAKIFISELYNQFRNKLIFMDIKSAEMTKYAANSMLATKISFINEIANICEKVGANILNVQKGIGSDTRIGNKFINAGCGYGGSCFPKDVKALIKTANDSNYIPQLLNAVEDVNYNQKHIISQKIIERYGANILSKLTIAVWGLSFKPNTDDMREAPALYMINDLLKYNVKIKAYDPQAVECCKTYYLKDGIEYCSSKEKCLKNADILIIATEWEEFIKAKIENMIIYDGRNCLKLENLNNCEYNMIGVR